MIVLSSNVIITLKQINLLQMGWYYQVLLRMEIFQILRKKVKVIWMMTTEVQIKIPMNRSIDGEAQRSLGITLSNKNNRREWKENVVIRIKPISSPTQKLEDSSTLKTVLNSFSKSVNKMCKMLWTPLEMTL